MKDALLIVHTRRDCNLFILDLAMPKKVIQLNTNTQTMMTTRHGKPTHLINCIKKVYIRYQRFEHANNTRIIYISELLDIIGDFSRKYNPSKIYSNSKTSNIRDSSDSLNNSSPQNIEPEKTSNNNPQTKITDKVKIFKITDLDFDEICEPCIESKQTRVVR